MKKGFKNLAILGMVFLGFAVLATPVFQVQAVTNLENVGFVPTNIWYSNESPAEGETIRVYTFIFNNSTGTLTGTAGFFEGTTLLGQKTFSLSPETSTDVYINWKATAGTHFIHAEISDAKIISTTNQAGLASLSSNKTSESKIFVPKTVVIPPKENATANDSGTPISGTDTSISIDSAVNLLPENISEPIKNSISSLEDWRAVQADSFESLKEKSKASIDKINSDKINTENSANGSKDSSNTSLGTVERDNNKTDTSVKKKEGLGPQILKPWEYVKYFFATLMSFVLGNKIVFYLVLIGLVFLIFRYFWRKVF